MRVVFIKFLPVAVIGLVGCLPQPEHQSVRTAPEQNAVRSSSSESMTVVDAHTASIAPFALKAVDANQADASLRIDESVAAAEPNAAQLDQLLQLAKKKFPELANQELYMQSDLIVPNSSLSLADIAEPSTVPAKTWSMRRSGLRAGPYGGVGHAEAVSNNAGAQAGRASGVGPRGSYGSVGVVSVPGKGKAGYVVGYVPGVGFGIAMGGIGANGKNGGGYCGISVKGAGCDYF